MRCDIRHELRLHHTRRFVILFLSLPQKRVNFVDEDDAGLRFAREGKQGSDEFVRVTEPFARDDGRGDIDERRS